MSNPSVIDLRSPSPTSPRPNLRSPPPDLPPTPPARFRTLLNPPRPSNRTHIIPEGTSGRRLADVIRERAEAREARELSADAALAWRRRLLLPRAGPSRAGEGREDEPIDLVGDGSSEDEDDDIILTGESNIRPVPLISVPPQRAGTPEVRMRRALVAEPGGYDRAMEGELDE